MNDRKRLILSKETIRNLNESDLKQVAGGGRITSILFGGCDDGDSVHPCINPEIPSDDIDNDTDGMIDEP